MLYCKNCHYHCSDYSDYRPGEYCGVFYEHPDLHYIQPDHTGRNRTVFTDKAIFICTGDMDATKRNIEVKFLLNKNFDCTFYKRKWWKFWVKEDIDGKGNQKK